MAESKFTLAQYTGALKNLLPRGRVWSRENSGIQHGLIEGLAKSFQQMDKDAVQLLVEAFPSTTTDLIDEWNATVGIPDSCFEAPESIEQNRQYIVAKLIADGGQTVDYYKSIAASLGLIITIREFSKLTPGTDANSCSTPSILIVLIANPSNEERRIRRRAFPMVTPYPLSSGLNSKKPWKSSAFSMTTLSGI